MDRISAKKQTGKRVNPYEEHLFKTHFLDQKTWSFDLEATRHPECPGVLLVLILNLVTARVY